MPVAVLALEKLNRIDLIDKDTYLNIVPGSDKLTGVRRDLSSGSGFASISHYIHKLFVVSDNDSFNRLYEFLGRDHINQRLWDLGYAQTRIRHRLSLSLTDEENRYTNAFQFFKDSLTIYEQPTQIAELDLDIPFNDCLLYTSPSPRDS